MNDFVSQLYGIIDTSFKYSSQQNGRRALIYLLGNNNDAIVAADILIYLLINTYDTKLSLLEQYDGFITRTYQQIEMHTGCSNLVRHKSPLNLLKKEGLIETHNNSTKRRTCFRVNTEMLIIKLDEAYEALGNEMRNFYEEFKDTLDKEREIRNTSHKDVDWETINNHLTEDPSFRYPRPSNENIDFLKGKGFKDFDILMMLYVQKYWKETYGTDYKWSEAEFNTLSLYLTSKGVTAVDYDRLKMAIQTLDEVDWLTKASTARKIYFRYFEKYRRFSK